MADDKYKGPDRREDKEHYVPWRYFVGTMSAFFLICGGYITLNETRLAAIQIESAEGHQRLEESIERRLSADKRYYDANVERFYNAAERNGGLLERLDTDIGNIKNDVVEIKTKQDLVLKKIRIAE